MGDTRDAVDPVDAIADLQRKLDDLQGTMLARVSRCPTGTIEPTVLASPKADTLLLNGATLNRADYPGLWQWVTDNSRVASGLFGAGDGSTTFVLPDFRGTVLRMPASGGTVGERLGADSVTLTSTHLPSHTHTMNTAGAHDHGGTGAAGGNHGNHNSGAVTAASALPGSQDFFFAGASNVQVGNAAHSHSLGSDGGHTHTINNTGSGGAVDIRQASVGVNWLIWT